MGHETAFTIAPILKHPDPLKPFMVKVDASESGVAVLSQHFVDKPKLDPIAFISKKLTPAEQNDGIGNWELLAFKLTLEEWRHCLERAKFAFTMFADHKNLEHLKTVKSLNSPQAYLSLVYNRFHFTLSHQPSSKIVKDDSLFYMYPSQNCDLEPKPILTPSCFISAITWDFNREIANAPTHQVSAACLAGHTFVPQHLEANLLPGHTQLQLLVT